MLAPAKTPPAIIAKINAEVVRMLQLADVKKIFANEAGEAVGNTPAEFAALIKSESAKWARVVQVGGIKIE